MVAHGPALTLELWESLDPNDDPRVEWLRPVEGRRVAMLLGAFDPPTIAHLRIAEAAGRAEGAPVALCMTKVLLARASDELLTGPERLRMLEEVAERRGLGLAVANRGTYLEVHRAVRASGIDPIFVIGSDKLDQLADPSFYADAEEGVAETFRELGFVVVPRPGSPADRADVRVLDVTDVFQDPAQAAISSTEVRRRVRQGERIDDLVPPEVARGLGGYTSAR